MGLVFEDDEPKVYGASLLSSNTELKRSSTDTVNRQVLDIETALAAGYYDISVQTQLFVAESLQDMRLKLL
jgi:phenylalanine-4-hydroxylase